jgi:hypothetical protein
MMAHYTRYEKKVLEEIKDWIKQHDSAFSKVLDQYVGRPLAKAYENLAPEAFQKGIEKVINGFLEMLKDASYWTFSKEWVVKDAQKLGLGVNQVSDLCGQDLAILDKLARSRFTVNKIVAGLEGAGTGVGGFSLIIADIPLLFGIAFRSIQEIGTCYGYEMDDPTMFPVIMSIFTVGSGQSSKFKMFVMRDLQTTASMIGKKLTYEEISKATVTGAFINFMKSRPELLPKLIAKNLTKRKLLQVIPYIGAVIGAGFNYWFVSEICRSAYMSFRLMYLSGKYPDEGETILDPEPEGPLTPNDIFEGYFNQEGGFSEAI